VTIVDEFGQYEPPLHFLAGEVTFGGQILPYKGSFFFTSLSMTNSSSMGMYNLVLRRALMLQVNGVTVPAGQNVPFWH